MRVTGEAAAVSISRARSPWVRAAIFVIALLALHLGAGSADAVVRTCGPDFVANTADVLCAPPSGPCDASAVSLSANIEIVDNVYCVFDLEGRALVVKRTIEGGHEQGFLFRNAGDVHVTSSGKIKSRGDFIKPFGFITGGGRIEIASSGAMVIDGVLDVSGDPAGDFDIFAAGDLTVGRRGRVLSKGISSFLDEDGRFADGGTIELFADGDLLVEGELVATSQALAAGGEICLESRRDVTVTRAIDLSGGDGDGGLLEINAGDHIAITASIDADSKAGGGTGGEIDLFAGTEVPGQREPGGGVTISDARLTLRGHGLDDFGGDGGEIDISALGDIVLSDVVLRADGSPNFDANGGGFFLDSNGDASDLIGELDGDIVIDGIVSANGSRGDSAGGEIELESGANITLQGSLTLLGSSGGEVGLFAGGDILMAAPIQAHARDARGAGGSAWMVAGQAALGTLRIARSIETSFGPLASSGGDGIDLEGCFVEIDEGVKVEHASGLPGTNAWLRLASRHPMILGAHSRFLAGPVGTVELRHPVGADPVIGRGVVFDPPAAETIGPLARPPCPDSICGNGIIGSPEECEDGNVIDGDGCSSSCRLECPAVPRSGCRREIGPWRGYLEIVSDDRYESRDRLYWLWAQQATTPIEDLGDPTTDDSYVLCLYDESGVAPVPIMRAVALAGAQCRLGPCWTRRPWGYRYENTRREPDGVELMSLVAGVEEQSFAGVTGKGELLQLSPLPLGLPLRAQLQTLRGGCWESTYSTARGNDEDWFSATSD